jgi:hypothetical protein
MKSLKNEKGSSSILVVLAFLMLGIFSVLGMMSSYSDYKLALKNASWNQQYDNLQGEVYSFVSDMDALLIENKNADIGTLKEMTSVMDEQIEISDISNGFIIAKEFEGESGKKMRLEMEYIGSSPERYSVIMMKEIPVIFTYEELEFTDVEVPSND